MEREPNVAYWQGREVSGYERKQRLLVPRKDELLDTVVDCIPFEGDQGIHVVDVGAGHGALSERILARYERAHVTLVDSSEEMLTVAQQRLAAYAPRTSFVAADFNAEDWHAPLEGPVHAVVSTLALQYLRTERRLPFFRDVYDLLSTPGRFLNGGAFDAEDPYIQQRAAQRMLEHTQRQLLETEGRQVSLEQLCEKTRRESGKAGVNRMALGEQLAMLGEAGFQDAEVVWRYLLLGVVAAYKR